MRISAVACLLALLAGAVGCSKTESDASSQAPTTPESTPESIPQTSGETIQPADWRAVIHDWYDNGVFDESHSCAAVRAAIERLPRSSRDRHTAFEDLGRYEARGCLRTRPEWVDEGVQRLRARFLDSPAPQRVTWGDSRAKRWVAIMYAQEELCGMCSHPAGAEPVRLKQMTIYFAPASTTVTGFSGR